MKSPQEGAGDYFSLVLGGWISFVCSFRILSTNCDTLTPRWRAVYVQNSRNWKISHSPFSEGEEIAKIAKTSLSLSQGCFRFFKQKNLGS